MVLSAASGADDYTFPTHAPWYVGPTANNPLTAAAKITSAAYSYGIGGGPRCGISGVNSDAWRENTLTGVSQVGNAITIVSFSNSGDTNTPQEQVTYTAGNTARAAGHLVSGWSVHRAKYNSWGKDDGSVERPGRV